MSARDAAVLDAGCDCGSAGDAPQNHSHDCAARVAWERLPDPRAAWRAVERLAADPSLASYAVDLAGLLRDIRVATVLHALAEEKGVVGGLVRARDAAEAELW